MGEQLAPASPSALSPFDDEHEAFRESVRRFLEREVVPSRAQWRRDGVPRGVFAAFAEYGFVAMDVPEELGGPGIEDLRFNAVVAEEATRVNLAGLGLMLSANSDLCAPLLVRRAHGDRRDEWLAGLATGEVVAAWAPPGPDAALAPDGDGWVLTGFSPGVVNGGIADLVVTAADAGDDQVFVALGTDAPGLTREPAEELVGPSACDRADLRFDAVAVPSSAVLGDDGAAVAREVATAEQLSLAAAGVAGARAALATTLEYVQERRAFGQLIASFQNTRFALADVAAEIDATEAFVYACLREHVEESSRLGPRRAAAAKLRATALFHRAADCGLQLHGGYGYMLEYEIAHAYSAARFLRLHGGADEALKDTIAGDLGI